MVFRWARYAIAVINLDVSLSKQSAVQSGSCVRAVGGTLKGGAVCVLQRKKIAIPGAHPENHIHRRRVKIDARALRRPDERNPYLRAFPRQMTFGINVSFLFKGN